MMNDPARPTRVRYWMIATTTLVAIMLYLDRVCLSIVGEQMQKDLPLTDSEFARLLSAFFWAYAVFQIPAGRLGDRYGARAILALYLFLWSACTGLMGVATGFVGLLVLRFGCGLFEAGAYPLAAGIVKRWIPAESRGFASACVAIGGRLGGAIAPTLTTSLAAGAADGWRRPFLIYGLVGMVGAVLFHLWYRDDPAEHPTVNRAEVDLIVGTTPTPPKSVALPPIPWCGLLESRAMWLNSLVQFLSNFAWVFIITLFPKYLKDVFHTPEATRAWLQAFPLYVGILGMLAGGAMTDWAQRSFGRRWGRSIPVCASRVVVGAAYLACLSLADPLAVAGMMCVVAFATDMANPAAWAFGQDVGGRQVGVAVGWANMWGNFGAALAPEIFIWVRDRYPADQMNQGWQAVFLLCAGSQLLGAVAALGLDSTRPIRGTEEPIHTTETASLGTRGATGANPSSSGTGISS